MYIIIWWKQDSNHNLNFNQIKSFNSWTQSNELEIVVAYGMKCVTASIIGELCLN